jgi:hypothetical protein
MAVDKTIGDHEAPRPKKGDVALACGHIDREDLEDEYWWAVVVSVQRKIPPAAFTATWLALCPTCHREYAETKFADPLLAQDFVVPYDIDFKPLD